MKKFELLKRTYPISNFDRLCDGYEYIMKNTTKKERENNNIDDHMLQKVIKRGEKYMYQVAKENGIFKIMHLSFNNFEIIRRNVYGLHDE